MDIAAAVKFQEDIDRAMGNYELGPVERIELGKGSEVMNLATNVDLRVHTRDGKTRGFTVIAKEFPDWVFAAGLTEPDPPRPDMIDVYTTGGPLVVVSRITGDTIVRGVLWYFELEEGRGGY